MHSSAEERGGGEAVGGTTRSRARLGVRRLCLAAVATIAAGGALVGGAEAVSAATPTLSFTPTTPVGPLLPLGIVVAGSGFSASTPGALLECSTVQNQPTIDVSIKVGGKAVDLGKLPVGCGQPTPEKTTPGGKLPATAVFSISGAGVLGPPATGTDSSGNDAATDAKDFPCPPTSAQASAQCVVMFVDSAGESATAPIQFTVQSTTTTTTPSSTTTAPESPTTTTTAALLNSQSSSDTGSGSSTSNATAASGSSLAFTGPSPMLWVMVLVGMAFVLFGGSLLLIVDVPRRLAQLTLARLTRPRRRRPQS
jgi:hypothetical protein